MVNALLTLCLAAGCLHGLSQSLIPELTFTNPRIKTGAGSAAAGEDNAVYIFSNVGYGIDALVSIRSRSSKDVRLTSADWNDPADTANTDLDNAWQPRVAFRNGEAPAHSRWWMEFSISFVSHGDHSKPVQVNQFLVTGLHLGGDGHHLHEFQTYYQPRQPRAEFAGLKFSGAAAGSSKRPAVVSNVYRGTSRFVLRVGAETGAGSSDAADRIYAFSFRSLYYDVPEAKPAPLMMLACNDRNIMTQPDAFDAVRND